MDDNIKKYLTTAFYHLEEAKSMLESGFLNGAVNRAYYAMFTAVHAALFPHGILAKSHSGAHNKFRELYLKNGLLPKELNQMLSAVFELRQEVDYDFEIMEDKEVAKEAVGYAEHFCTSINEFLEKHEKL